MTGSSILTMFMFLALALFAYTQALPRAHAAYGTASSLFSHAPLKNCPLGTHYSSFYRGCSAWAQTKS